MDCLCAKFGDFSFIRFGFIVRTDTHTNTESQRRIIDRYTVGVSKYAVSEVVANPKIILQEKQISKNADNSTGAYNWIIPASNNGIIRNMNQVILGLGYNTIHMQTYKHPYTGRFFACMMLGYSQPPVSQA